MLLPMPSAAKAAQIEELKAFIGKERDGRQIKKALAVKLLYQGYGYEAVVQILDVSMGSLSNWKQTYEVNGISGFQPQHQGRKSYLSETQKQEVLQWLQQKDIWTLGELESHLAEAYEVVYESKQSYYDLFEAADISWKKTSPVNPKADPKAVAAKKSKLKGSWLVTARRLKSDS
jgi:putative transposase